MLHTFRSVSLAFFATILLISPALSQAQKRQCPHQTLGQAQLQIHRVQDGDSVVLKDQDNNRFTARLVGIDTPEAYYKGHSQGEWAYRAKNHLMKLLPPGSPVTVEFDRIPCDFNGRLLAHVHFNGVHINRHMIEEGLAVNYCVAPNYRYCAELGEITDQNRAQQKGFWSDPSVTIPYLFREQVRGGEFTYHVGDIKSYEVVLSNQIEQITPGRRVIFYDSRHVKPPYRLR